MDGSYHEVDSSEVAFKIAGSLAFRDGTVKGDPVIMEPVFKVEVTTPDEYMGDVIGDMNSRRGYIEGVEARGNLQVVTGYVPLKQMFGYATDLRSRTQGRGVYNMQFDHYEELPASITQELLKNKGLKN